MLNEVTRNASILMLHNAAADGRAPQDLLLKRIMRLRARLSFTMTAATLTAYFGYILIIAFEPQWLVIRINDDTLVTTGLLAAIGLFAFSALGAGSYMWFANRKIDPLIEAINGMEQTRLSDGEAR